MQDVTRSIFGNTDLWPLWVEVFARTIEAAATSAAVGIDGAAPIRCTQIEAAALA